MRTELAKLQGKRCTFMATFERYGSRKIAFSIYPQITMLFLNVTEKKSGKKVTDHIWMKCGKRMDELGEFIKGEKVQFDARVRIYIKGYRGRLAMEMGEDWSERDWQLSFPTNIKRVEKQKKMKEFSMCVFTMIAVAAILNLALIFYSAYITPDKMVRVFVNRQNEGFVEAFFIIPSLLFCSFMAAFVALKGFLRDSL